MSIQLTLQITKPLSEKEYLDQSRVETENALKKLRDHCQSPDDLSKVASKLESPDKFESFVRGASHVNQNEIVEHTNNTTINQSFTPEGGLEDSTEEEGSDSNVDGLLLSRLADDESPLKEEKQIVQK